MHGHNAHSAAGAAVVAANCDGIDSVAEVS
jgi:hypothetical protein